MPKKTIMRALKINEISVVDRPAQEGALMSIMKRNGDDIFKSFILLSDEDGHSHLLDLDEEGGTTSWGHTGEDDTDHTHPWVRNEDGTVTIGAAVNHTHTPIFKRVFMAPLNKKVSDLKEEEVRQLLPSLPDLLKQVESLESAASNPTGGGRKLNKEGTMPKGTTEKTAEEVAALEADLEKAQAELARSQALGEMTDAQKAYFGDLDKENQETFITKSTAARQELVDKAAEKDAVVYTADDGSEYRKSDDPRLVAMAKKTDEDRKELKKSNEALAQAGLEKRASTDLAFMKGDEPTKVALLKAVDGIKDKDTREKVLEAIKSNNADMAKAFDTQGVVKSAEATTAGSSLDEMAKQHQAKNTGMTYEKAFSVVCETPEGQKLYAASLN